MGDKGVVRVEHRHEHSRGSKVALCGKLYTVDAFGFLSPDPDAAGVEEAARFPATFRVRRPKAPKKPTPPPPAPPVVAPKADSRIANFIKLTVAEMREVLAQGEHDDLLLDLMAAEESAGKSRKTAVDAIQDRIDDLKE